MTRSIPIARSVRVIASFAMIAVVAASALGCRGNDAASPCGPEGDAKRGARTGVEGAKTGVATGVEGVKTFGNATAGLATGGSDEASQRWKDGKEKTKATANEGSASTKSEAHSNPCK